MTAGSLPDLMAELKRHDPERWIATLWAPARMRPLLAALLLLDLELERVVAEAGEPLVAEIRLAWWRERLLELAEGKPPPPQPLLKILGREARAVDLDLGALAGLEDALLPLLTEGPLDLVGMARARGETLAQALCAAFGTPVAPAAKAAGLRVALARFARRPWGRSQPAVSAALEAWRGTPLQPPGKGRPGPRVLEALERLACRDLEDFRAGRPLAPAGGAGRQVAIARVMLGLSFGAAPC